MRWWYVVICALLLAALWLWQRPHFVEHEVFQLVSTSLLTEGVRAKLDSHAHRRYRLTKEGVCDVADGGRVLRHGTFTGFGTYQEPDTCVERIVTTAEGDVRVREDGQVATVHKGWVSCGPNVYPVGHLQVVEWFGPYLLVEHRGKVNVYLEDKCVQVIHPSRPVSALAQLEDMLVLVGERVSFFNNGRDTVELYRCVQHDLM